MRQESAAAPRGRRRAARFLKVPLPAVGDPSIPLVPASDWRTGVYDKVLWL